MIIDIWYYIHIARGKIMICTKAWWMEQIHKLIIFILSESIRIITFLTFWIINILAFFIQFKGIMISHNNFFTKVGRKAMFPITIVNGVSIPSIMSVNFLVSRNEWRTITMVPDLWFAIINWVDKNLGIIRVRCYELSFMLYYHRENLIKIW